MSEPATARGVGGLELADRFLRFFEARGHTIVPSSSLVPADDPTLLFTNAGMVQFKDVFLGRERRSYARAATLQRCLRVSGKHNDLDAVGPSPYHQTLFFMLGNFSFGDYFKSEAIPWAWEFVTRDLAIPGDRLIATVLQDDDDSYKGWKTLDLPESRILRMGEETNFWAMGPTGPCGPNSELHYDWGPEFCTCGRPDCSVALDNGCRRWLEIWNLVFMQYDQTADRTRTPLPRPGVDTGMGLERIAAVIQQVPSTYDTDLFTPILAHIQAMLRHSDERRREALVPYRVIADHGRAAVFLIADGVVPGNEGRAYVLRMILRRAIRFGRRAGFTGPFLGEVAGSVIELMGKHFPDLERRREFILKAMDAEEIRFSQTLTTGLERLTEVIAGARGRGLDTIPGEEVFRLYDTYGFPVEMTRDVARESSLAVDEAGFHAEMDAQRQRSRAAGTVPAVDGALDASTLPATEFIGYTKETGAGVVLAVFKDGRRVEEADAGEQVTVVLDRTPFYAEAGGQVGDTGILTARGLRIEIVDTRRITPAVVGHLGRVVRGRLRAGSRVRAAIDGERRAATKRNHTATHLLHRALQEILGDHARQQGSLVAPDRLRFDFSHLAPVSAEERAALERRVNEIVLADRAVRASTMPLAEAQRRGAMALFGEKYGEHVRVVEVAGYSKELCGGTHLTTTGQIGLFTITGEGSVAAGVRRIDAVTGWPAYERTRAHEHLITELANTLRTTPAELPERVRRLSDQARAADRASAQAGGKASGAVIREPVEVDGVRVTTARIDGAGHDELRLAGDDLRVRVGGGVFVLAGVAGHRVNVVAMVSGDLHDRGVRADAVLRAVAARLGGTGGGRADIAQGGGRDIARLDEALDAVPGIIRDLVTT